MNKWTVIRNGFEYYKWTNLSEKVTDAADFYLFSFLSGLCIPEFLDNYM